MMMIASLPVIYAFLITLNKKVFVESHVTGNVLTNDIVDNIEESTVDLPFCRAGSACGYLQVNAFGISPSLFCRCPSKNDVCSLQWDPQDGHSVTMGYQQFKFCRAAPYLHVCSNSEPAYTSAFLFDRATFDVMGVIHKVHCLCPPPRKHLQHGSTEDSLDNMLVLGTAHRCGLLPDCDVTSVCKEITITEGKSLVLPKCRCPRGTACPTLSSYAEPNEMNDNFFRGKAYSIRCQRLF